MPVDKTRICVFFSYRSITLLLGLAATQRLLSGRNVFVVGDCVRSTPIYTWIRNKI